MVSPKKAFMCFAAVLLAATSAAPCFPSSGRKSAPGVSAESAILIEGDSGRVIMSKDPDKKLPMASTTKIMTALVVLENGGVDGDVTVPPEAAGVEGSSAYLKSGEVVPKKDLLYALMLQSANDAAVALAVDTAGSVEDFASMMNDRAEKLGLDGTHFTNPHGLSDDGHYTTARDLARLTAYALKNPVFEKIVSTYEYTTSPCENGVSRVYVNHNRLLRDLGGAVGVKTGYTRDSGRCLVSAVRRDGLLTVAVTLSDPDDWRDHKALHEYGHSVWSVRVLAEPREVTVDVPCVGGDVPTVRLSNSDYVRCPLPDDARITKTVECDRFFTPPVARGDAVGTVVFYADGKEVASAPLFAEHGAAESPGKLSFTEQILNFLGR
ncbi:MAG: D-alanyl-D-alanine carboxypeptidase [Clostridia bacterium]|nr:D-alanyl-D-alanine carboxypeptidase [Clostridia bacterium]MBR6291073.1 D-alanyl-D-alanine carboxypeptidase [Clostridia bacterium]